MGLLASIVQKYDVQSVRCMLGWRFCLLLCSARIVVLAFSGEILTTTDSLDSISVSHGFVECVISGTMTVLRGSLAPIMDWSSPLYVVLPYLDQAIHRFKSESSSSDISDPFQLARYDTRYEHDTKQNKHFNSNECESQNYYYDDGREIPYIHSTYCTERSNLTHNNG
jgi:hypothetical protein